MSDAAVQFSQAEYSPHREPLTGFGRFILATPAREIIDRSLAEKYVGGFMLSNSPHWVNLLDMSVDRPGDALLDITESTVEPLQARARQLEDPEDLTVEGQFFNKVSLESKALQDRQGSFNLGGSAVFATENGTVAGLLVPHYLLRQVGGVARRVVSDYNYHTSRGMAVSEENSRLAKFLKSMPSDFLNRLISTTAGTIVAKELPNTSRIYEDLHLRKPNFVNLASKRVISDHSAEPVELSLRQAKVAA